MLSCLPRSHQSTLFNFTFRSWGCRDLYHCHCRLWCLPPLSSAVFHFAELHGHYGALHLAVCAELPSIFRIIQFFFTVRSVELICFLTFYRQFGKWSITKPSTIVIKLCNGLLWQNWSIYPNDCQLTIPLLFQNILKARNAFLSIQLLKY